MSWAAGHAPTRVARIPADTSTPALAYFGLCQCGWTTHQPLRVTAENMLRHHQQRSPSTLDAGWWCPCGVESRTRRLRDIHMSLCPSSPKAIRL